jgi:tetratricopeptide (TPR) repeat protein
MIRPVLPIFLIVMALTATASPASASNNAAPAASSPALMPAASAPQAARAATGAKSTSSPTPLAPSSAPPDRATADAVAYTAGLQAVSQVSERAIEAAHHASTETNELFEKLVWLVGGLGIVFGIFGVSSIRTLKKNVAAQAKARVDEALIEVNAKAKEEVAKALLDMKSHIDTAVARTAETAENARDLLLNVAEATRNFTLAKAFAEATIDKQEYFESAVNSCLRARDAAKKLGDIKQIAWTFSFEAYCRRARGDYEGAIKAAEESESLYQRDDPTLHFNLACYLCLAGHDDRAHTRLLLAFTHNADGSMSSYARNEKDFDRWRRSGLYPELVGGKGGIEPGGG